MVIGLVLLADGPSRGPRALVVAGIAIVSCLALCSGCRRPTQVRQCHCADLELSFDPAPAAESAAAAELLDYHRQVVHLERSTGGDRRGEAGGEEKGPAQLRRLGRVLEQLLHTGTHA